ncbi:unnamed protein product [Durusdinium trenchii]|uniref:Phospholipase D-like domain-containing protein n=1 Tax=Durusdinium trenchii TaxID=1381693 RepID=A0ABP0NVW3_9DINO
MAETALSAFASGEHRHQAGPSQPEPAEAAVRSSKRKRGGLKHKKSHKKLRRAKKKTPSAAEARVGLVSQGPQQEAARSPREWGAAAQPPSRAAVCFLAVPVLRETDEVLDVASEALQDVILEGSAQVRSALNVVGMGVQMVAVWFVSTMMMNLWQRCRNGNTAEYGARLTELTDGGSVWVVKSKRGAFHQVNLKKGHASCACRQYVEEGVRPHIKAAKEQLKRLALPSEPAEPPKASPLREALPKEKGRGDRPEPLALQDSKASTPELLPEPSLQTDVELLVNTASQDRILNILAGAGEVMMTAYTFDQPDVVDSLIRRPGVTRLLVDRGQSVGERTKLQRQSLLQVARAGIRVRLTAGSSIAEAYAGDRRGTSVGKSLKGIQHSKTFCLRGAEGAPSFLVVGSSNYTTSSRANVELGLLVSGPWEDEVFHAYTDQFERLWAVSEIFGGPSGEGDEAVAEARDVQTEPG